MRNKKLEVIACPKCGKEYLPAEIFLPNDFLGKPSHIERDCSGKIDTYIGNSMNTYETYTCTKCNTTFKITAKVSFLTEIKDNINFDEDYVTSLKKDSLFLSED